MIESLYIIIVNWNHKEDTLACISSLLEAGARLGNIVVVDNGSTDDSIVSFEEAHQQKLNIIRNTVNRGFAAGANTGILWAIKSGANWILILNNDTVVAPTLFTELSHAIMKFPNIDIFSPLIFYFHEKNKIWSSGNKLIPGTLITYSLYKNKNLEGEISAVLPVDFITGCGMLINSIVFKEIGLFNEDYFMYAEDVDFCFRAKNSGFNIACATNARIWHKVSSSAGQNNINQIYLRTKNQNIFYRRNSTYPQKIIMLFFTFIKLIFKCSCLIYRNQIYLIKPLFSGYIDGWFQPV